MEILQYARLDGPERRAQHFVYRVGRCWPRPARSGLRSARYTYSSGRFAEPPETPATMEGGVRRGKRERGAASPVVRLSVGEATGRVPAPVFRRSKNTSWNRPGARPPARRAPDRTCGASGVPLAPAAWRLCRVLPCLNTVEQLLHIKSSPVWLSCSWPGKSLRTLRLQAQRGRS